MRQHTASNSGGGIGFVGVLTIVFIVLRLTEVIDWAWWWVLAPIWISAAVALGLIVLVGGILLLVAVISGRRKNQRRKRLESRIPNR